MIADWAGSFVPVSRNICIEISGFRFVYIFFKKIKKMPKFGLNAIDQSPCIVELYLMVI